MWQKGWESPLGLFFFFKGTSPISEGQECLSLWSNPLPEALLPVTINKHSFNIWMVRGGQWYKNIQTLSAFNNLLLFSSWNYVFDFCESKSYASHHTLWPFLVISDLFLSSPSSASPLNVDYPWGSASGPTLVDLIHFICFQVPNLHFYPLMYFKLSMSKTAQHFSPDLCTINDTTVMSTIQPRNLGVIHDSFT